MDRRLLFFATFPPLLERNRGYAAALTDTVFDDLTEQVSVTFSTYTTTTIFKARYIRQT